MHLVQTIVTSGLKSQNSSYTNQIEREYIEEIYSLFTCMRIVEKRRIFRKLGGVSMAKYILQRTGYMIITLLIVTSLTFFLMKLIPGSPFNNFEKLSDVQRAFRSY